VILEYLSQCLSASEIETIVRSAIKEIGARGVGDMGKLMTRIKDQLQGRADLSEVSALVKSLLG
jgi:uncharacterized protein YqeY